MGGIGAERLHIDAQIDARLRTGGIQVVLVRDLHKKSWGEVRLTFCQPSCLVNFTCIPINFHANQSNPVRNGCMAELSGRHGCGETSVLWRVSEYGGCGVTIP